jgi:hypothetical protein
MKIITYLFESCLFNNFHVFYMTLITKLVFNDVNGDFLESEPKF